MGILVLMLHLNVRNYGSAVRTPVDNFLTPVDVAFFIVVAESFSDSLLVAFVHGEGESVPVRRDPKALLLTEDYLSFLLFPLPDFFDKRFTTDVKT